MIWMLALCCFVTVYLSYALRTQKRQGLLVTGIVAIVTLSGSFYLYWNLGAYEMSLSTQALIDLPANERAHVIAQAAQDEFLANNRVADPNVIELLNLALDLDPDQITALGTLGIIAFEGKEFARAESYWSHMLSQLPEGSEEAGAISEGISRAREQAVRIEQTKLKNGASEISVTLQLAREVPASMKAATVFVFALEVHGSPRPLVAKRLPVSRLPTTITLSNADAVMGGGLYNDQRVEVRARLTLGEATGAQGDWLSESVVVQTLNKNNSIELTLVPPAG